MPTSSSLVEWSSHTFCTYTICRASLPARAGLHDIDTHFTHLPLRAMPAKARARARAKAKAEPERKSSAVVFTGREEWMDGYADADQGEEVDDELVGMERLTPILSEE
jgi:hypothetical protein